MRKFVLTAICLSAAFGCSKNEEVNHEKLVSSCWSKYEHNPDGLVSDPDCSNLAVISRLERVHTNRLCGYPDLYAGELDLNQVDLLPAKDKEYVKNTLSCVSKYKSTLTRTDHPYFKNNYSERSFRSAMAALEEDVDCNNPSSVAMMENLFKFTGPDTKGELGGSACWGKKA